MPADPYIGEPINVATGNAYVEQEDFVQGDLSLRRYYNSDPNVRVTHSGLQWLNTYDRTLSFSVASTNAANDDPLSPTQVMAQRQDGQELVFNKVNGVWQSDADISDVLTEVDDSNGYVLSWTLFDATTRRYEMYSPMGVLLSINDEDGNRVLLTLTYTNGTQQSSTGSALPVGLLWSVTDTYNRTLTFNYDDQQNLTLVTEPDGGELQYGYNAADDLISVTYPGSTQRQYLYDEAAYSAAGSSQNKLTGIIDESNGRYTTFGYQADGRAISTQEGNGADLNSVSYASSGTAATVTYPLGQQATATFIEPQGTAVVSAMSARCGEQCSQQYQSQTLDASGYPASTTDFNDNLTTTQYNDYYGLLHIQVDGSGTASQRTTTTVWNGPLREPLTRQVQNAQGTLVAEYAWAYNYLGEMNARCEIDPAVPAAMSYACSNTTTAPAGVRQWGYSYCGSVNTTQCPVIGLMTSMNGPRTDVTDVTSYTYYMLDGVNHHHGDLATVTDPLSHVTTYLTYDGAGRVLTMQDANGVVTTLTYTPRGWLASRSEGGATTQLTYWPYGAIKTVTDPDNVTTTFTYDGAHRLTDITDVQGNDIHYTLDASGNKTGEQVRTASGTVVKSLSRQYNTLGQLTAVIDGLSHTVFSANTSTSYDPDGNLVNSVDARGYQRQQSYDALNRLSRTIDNYNGTDPATSNTTTQVTLDARDRLTGVTDPTLLNTTYTYDGLNNRTQLQSPDTGTSTDTYDAAGNRLVHTDAKGNVGTSTYDADNRLASTSYGPIRAIRGASSSRRQRRAMCSTCVIPASTTMPKPGPTTTCSGRMSRQLDGICRVTRSG